MPRPKKEQFNPADALRHVGESLRTQALQPNLYRYKPHKKQKIFHTCDQEEFITEKQDIQKVRFYVGGNRSGKTVGGIVEDIWWVTKEHPFIDIEAIWPEPIRGRICTTDFVNGGEGIIIPALKRWCPASKFKGGSWESAWDAEERTIHFENGGFIELRSYDQQLDKHAGTSRHFVHFDEEPPEDIYGENMARLMDTGGRCWFTMTPVEGMTWTYDRLYEPGSTGKADFPILIVNVSVFDNPHIDAEEVKIFQSLWGDDDDEASMRVEGTYISKTGLIYPGFSKETHVIDPWFPKGEGILFATLDHGLANPTVWLYSCLLPSGRIITFYEYYQKNRVVKEHALEVLKINKELGREPDFYVGDPSIRNTDPITRTSILEEYGKFGIFIQANPGLNPVSSGIDRVRSYMKPVYKDEAGKSRSLWAVTSNCEHTIWEISHYRWDDWKSKGANRDHNKKEVPRKKDDHTCDALRYLLMSRPDFAEVAKGLRVTESPLNYSPVEAKRAAKLVERADIPKSAIKSDGWEYDPGIRQDKSLQWSETSGW